MPSSSVALTWRPNVTVAAIIERDGRFLMVEERVDGARVWNQPAGHLEDGESLVDAVVRETLEETAWAFRPDGLVGIYRWPSPDSALTYLRFTFYGRGVAHDPDRALDPDIERCGWLSRDALSAEGMRLRSPMVLRSVDDYLAGQHYPLDLLVELEGRRAPA
jgi:8-oxo-dGTP pyrophosphatase MutT (NUDIX family)